VTSGQGARKRRKCIYFDHLLFLLPTMQRDTSGSITPPPSANESKPQDIRTGNEIGGSSHAKSATYYRQQKKRSKTTYEEFLLEIIKEKRRDDIHEDKSFLMSVVLSFKTLNYEQKFVAKVEFLNVMRCITFCEPPYHVSSPTPFQLYSNLPGPSAHTSYIGTPHTITIPFRTHHNICNNFQHQHSQQIHSPNSQFKRSPQHFTSTNSSTLPHPCNSLSPSDGKRL
jgi:hypothetical protein